MDPLRQRIYEHETKLKSTYYQSLLKASWRIVETQLSINSECLNMGYDIQNYFALYKSLTMDDLVNLQARHTTMGLVKVIRKVLRHLDNLSACDTYLACIGRLHCFAGVDEMYLNLTGLAFTKALTSVGTNADIWNDEVKNAWLILFEVIVNKMCQGYEVQEKMWKQPITTEQKSVINEVWISMQENVIHYLKNSLLLPLVMRSNKIINKYFLTYDAGISLFSLQETDLEGTLEKTKHAVWFITSILNKVIPLLDSLGSVETYLVELGKKHMEAGVHIQQLDILTLVFCSAVKAVMSAQGMKGGPLFEATKIWLRFLRVIVSCMKKGYTESSLREEQQNTVSQIHLTLPSNPPLISISPPTSFEVNSYCPDSAGPFFDEQCGCSATIGLEVGNKMAEHEVNGTSIPWIKTTNI